MMEWHPVFRAGRTRVQVSFTGGCLCGGASTAASYETSDPVVQALIECSPAFRIGRISVRGEVRKGSATPASGATVMEFPDLDKASDFLQREKGVRIDDILTKEKCIAEARRLGIALRIKDTPAR